MKKMVRFLTIIFILVGFSNFTKAEGTVESPIPSYDENRITNDHFAKGFVPNKEVAIAVAEAILFPIYGESNIKKQRPYHVELINDIWLVEGTLAQNYLGGVFMIKIAKKDAAISYLNHSK